MVVVEVLGRLGRLPGVHTYFVQLYQWSARRRETPVEELTLMRMHSTAYYVGTGTRFTLSPSIPKRLNVHV